MQFQSERIIAKSRRPVLSAHRSHKARAKPVDMSLIQFVEALAIADARRDYLALNDPIARKEAGGGRRTLQAGVSTHDARSRLRKILD